MVRIKGESMTTKADETNEVLERLAGLEHEQWVAWSKDIVSKEKLTKTRLARWKTLCGIRKAKRKR